MIRALVIVTVSGLIISVVCLSIAGAMGGQALMRGDWDWVRWIDFDRDGETDLGPRTTRELAWTGAESLDLSIPSEVIYVQSPDNQVVLNGPERLLDRIELSGGDIRLTDGARWRRWGDEARLEIEIRAPAINTFELNGAQQVEIRDYDQDTLTVEVNGAAQVEASGRAGRAELEMNGAGDIDLGDLALSSARIEMNGAGDVTAGPIEAVEVEINGVGEVTLLRQPATIRQEIHGFGRVRVRDDETATPEQDDAEGREDVPAKSSTLPPAK